MRIRYTKVYEINTYHLTAKEFILLVNSYYVAEFREDMESLEIPDAVALAADFFDQGDLTDLVDIVDHRFEYIDCAGEDLKMSWAERMQT